MPAKREVEPTDSLSPVALTTSDHRTLTSRIARQGRLGLLTTGVGSVTQFLLILLITRSLPLDASGAFFTGTSLFLIILAVTVLGVDQGYVWHLSSLTGWGRQRDISTSLRAGLWPVAICAAGVAIVVMSLSDTIAGLMVGSFGGGSALVLFLGLALLPASLELILLASTRGLGVAGPTAFIDSLLLPVLQFVGVALAILLGGDLAAVGLGWSTAYLVVWLLAALSAHTMFIRHKAAVPDNALPARPRSEVRREFWLNTIPRVGTRLSQIGLQRADIAIVGLLLSLREAAIYTAASRMIVLGQIGTQAVVQMAQPHFARLLSVGDDVLARGVYRTTTTWFVLGTWPLYLLSIVLAPDIIELLLGDRFRSDAAVGVLVVLSAGMLIASVIGPIDTVLTMSGRSGLSLVNFALALVIDLVLLAILLPIWGIFGAGVAWAVAIASRNIITLVQVDRLHSVNPFCPTLVKSGLLCLLCFGALPGLSRLATHSLPAVLIALAVGGCLFVGMLWRWRDDLELAAFFGRRVGEPAAAAP